MTKKYYHVEKTVCPVLLARTEIVFPGGALTFDLESEREEAVLDQAVKNNQEVLLLALQDPSVDNPGLEDYMTMGTMVAVRQNFQLLGGNSKVIVEGLCRAEIQRFIRTSPYVEAEVVKYHYDPDELEENDNRALLARLVSSSALSFFRTSMGIPDFLLLPRLQSDDPGALADEVASHLDLSYEEAQDILTELNVDERLVMVQSALDLQAKLTVLEQQISEEAQDRVKKNQKDYLIQEQIQILREQMDDDGSDPLSIAESYEERVKALKMPEEAREVVLKEVEKLTYLSPMSPDVNVSRTYLDTILALPWGKYTKDRKDLVKSQEILDRDHYGLKDVKDRILEFMAVRQLRADSKGSILCLVGPPGVGKTSIVRSIARAIKREFTSMRLGGVTDESEIRGHRKTYIGAMPGRVIAQMMRSKSMNPVFLFDEVDKIGSDFRGDPASALLEVLDPEQNFEFHDRYLEVPFDLSQVMFITTANTTTTIPRPLLDRMEVIRIPGYTEDEKLEIAARYLVKKQREEAGLKAANLAIPRPILTTIIRSYTRESGVRELERQIGKICRRSARKIVEGADKVRVNQTNLSDFLGQPKYLDDERTKTPQIGVVNGLAWTEVGGELLLIEANKMAGRGGLLLTGSMGEVMKESAELAISYIRSNAGRYGISSSFYTFEDIHIHMPEGSVPKDGPSAGVSILTAIVSILTQRPVRSDVAMTGEITLNGHVLPVGGIREKVLAAKRYGIDTVFLPKENMRDLEEVEKASIEGMTFIPVDRVDDLIQKALLSPVEREEEIIFESDKKAGTIGFSRNHEGKEEEEARPRAH
ncbi:endopeptidase La [Kallipyga massiliensis]|uniref:endopeptidase La n=1 Tax=Kallipyga massiliensis TaxID=1472764 RepID=UPI0026F37B79|nr:endopeptidase La [Kallipyga massiliensis]